MKLSDDERKKFEELRVKHSKEEQLVDSLIKRALNKFKIVAVIKEDEGVIDETLIDEVVKDLKIGIERLYGIEKTYEEDIVNFNFIKAEYTDKKMKELQEYIKTYEEILKMIENREGKLFE